MSSCRASAWWEALIADTQNPATSALSANDTSTTTTFRIFLPFNLYAHADRGHDRLWLRSWPGLVEAPIGARGTGTTPAGSPSALMAGVHRRMVRCHRARDNWPRCAGWSAPCSCRQSGRRLRRAFRKSAVTMQIVQKHCPVKSCLTFLLACRQPMVLPQVAIPLARKSRRHCRRGDAHCVMRSEERGGKICGCRSTRRERRSTRVESTRMRPARASVAVSWRAAWKIRRRA